MKTILLVLSVIIFAACSKTNVAVQPPAADNDASSLFLKRSASEILYSHKWMYEIYRLHYVDKTNQGSLEYRRGGSSNVINLDSTVFTFHKNGTFLEIDAGYRFPGTWNFTNDADTVVIMKYNFGTDVETVLVLNKNHFNYTIPSGYRNEKTYTELIPAL